MTVEQALKVLEQKAKIFSEIKDPKEYIKKDKKDFLNKWREVNQYYRYIISKVDYRSDEFNEAVNIIGDIAINNPSLDEWVSLFVETKTPKKEKNENDEDIDEVSLANRIESYLLEIENMHGFDPKYAADIKYQLQKYQKVLQEKKNDFSPGLYQSLNDDINNAIGKIDKLHNLVNSEIMESVKRM